MDEKAIYLPEVNEILVVRGTLNGNTVMWSLKVDRARWLSSPLPHQLELVGRITGAEIYAGLDERIARQREIIDRLMKHLWHHCERPGACDWEGS